MTRHAPHHSTPSGLLVWYVVRRHEGVGGRVYLTYVKGPHEDVAGVSGMTYAVAWQLLKDTMGQTMKLSDPEPFLLGPGPQHLYGPDVPYRRQLDVPEYVIGVPPQTDTDRWTYLTETRIGSTVQRFAASGSAEELLSSMQEAAPPTASIQRACVVAI